MVKSIAARLPAAVWLILGGLFVALIGAVFLPFFTVKNTILGSAASIDVANTGVMKFVVVLLVAGAVWLAWPLLRGSPMPTNRLIGLTVVIGLLIAGAAVDALFNDVFSSSGSDDDLVSVSVMPGFGLLLYGAAMVAAAVGVVMVWAQRSKLPPSPV
jgi:hypothetical protein